MAHGWTLAQMPRQDGRRAIITGGNSGIGYAAALELARHGATVILACRSRAKAETAALRLNNQVPGSHIEVELLDLASLRSVRSFAQRELGRSEPLDLLINNAGVYTPPTRMTTADGLELQFGTNVVGHFALTGLLLPKLEARGRHIQTTGGLVQAEQEPPRVVTIASIAHRHGRLHWDDLQFEHAYKASAAYAQSKLANLVLAIELDRRLRARNIPVLSTAAHPGIANTNLFIADHNPSWQRSIRSAAGRLIELILNSSEQGALPTLYAAASPDAVSGGYYGPNGVFEIRGATACTAKINPRASDEASGQRLWTACEELSGVRYLDEPSPVEERSA